MGWTCAITGNIAFLCFLLLGLREFGNTALQSSNEGLPVYLVRRTCMKSPSIMSRTAKTASYLGRGFGEILNLTLKIARDKNSPLHIQMLRFYAAIFRWPVVVA